MEDDLAKRLDNIEKSIIELKTRQDTQNDSYKIYTFRTENLTWQAEHGSRDYVVRFIPKVNDGSAICQFYGVDLVTVQMITQAYVDVNDLFKCSMTVFAYDSSIPVGERRAYITCLANCDGELQVSYT